MILLFQVQPANFGAHGLCVFPIRSIRIREGEMTPAIAAISTTHLAFLHRVSSLLYDHTSVLRLIEWRWGLAPLTPPDASADLLNLACDMNFSHPDPIVPTLPNPSVLLLGAPCLQALPGALLKGASRSTVGTQLGKYAAGHGFHVKDVV